VRRGVTAGQTRLTPTGHLMAMALYRVRLAYDGTDFQGWQLQAPAKHARTVQGELENALGHLAAGERVRVSGAGRTDSGVHALGQVACFELSRPMQPPELLRALNGLLSQDVRVLDVSEAPSHFNPRKDASSKLYRYVLDMGAPQLPTRRRYAGHVPICLDRSEVREAAKLYQGCHDFASLASAGGSIKTTVRTVMRSSVRFEEQAWSLVYEVEADGFLRRMVRSLVGGLIAVGSRRLSVVDLERALEAQDRRAWPAPAPARGLTLVSVSYATGGTGAASEQ
jgi:tRNA pseudouridine38-40 synthase